MRTVRGMAGLVGALALLAGLLARPDASGAAPGEKPAGTPVKAKAAFADIAGLHAEISALQVLRGLMPTPAQLDALERLSARTMQEAPLRKLVKVSERYRKTLRGLRTALLAGDDEACDELFATLDELGQKEAPELEDIELTDAARRHAPRLVQALSARQVAGYLATVADFPDPFEQLMVGCEAGRKMRGPRWDDHRDDVAYLFGWLVGGVDAKKEAKAREKATAFLNKAHRLDAKAYAAGREALFREGRQLIGELGPTDVLRHYMERVVAEVLSNHRLAAAVGAWRKRG
jgi:hypothetical protein